MNFGVYRKIGIGDIENVRAGLLQVLCLHKDYRSVILAQEAIRASRVLNKTLRMYFNADLMSDDIQRHLCFQTFSVCRDYDLMLQHNVTSANFKWVYERCDVVFDPETPVGSHSLLVDSWNSSGGRELVHQRHKAKGEKWVRDQYSHLEIFPVDTVALKFTSV